MTKKKIEPHFQDMLSPFPRFMSGLLSNEIPYLLAQILSSFGFDYWNCILHKHIFGLSLPLAPSSFRSWAL